MAFLTCRVCGWTGNRGTSCPDAESCGWNTLVTDEVDPIEVDATEAAQASVYESAKALIDAALPPVHPTWMLVPKGAMDALRAALVEATVELSEKGGQDDG